MRTSRRARRAEEPVTVARRELLEAAAWASCAALSGCATTGAVEHARYEGAPIEPSCRARFCRQFVADPELGEGRGRCKLGVRG